MTEAVPEGEVHLWHEGILFLGTGIRNAPHRHFTASLSFALDAPFAFRTGRGAWRRLRGVAVASNVTQQMDCRGATVVILQIDPETDAYGRMARLFAQQGAVVELGDAVVDRLVAAAAAHRNGGAPDPVGLWTAVLDDVAGARRTPATIDPRVARVLEIVKRELPAVPSCGALAAAVGLSPGRLSHLWSGEVGMPLRRYVLWLRLRHVVARVSIGHSLTEAAHEAGFADSAHLSRTFSSMFGLPLSRLFGPAARVRLFLTLPDAELSGPHAPYDRERWEAVARRLGRVGPRPDAALERSASAKAR